MSNAKKYHSINYDDGRYHVCFLMPKNISYMRIDGQILKNEDRIFYPTDITNCPYCGILLKK
jgi:hypothetical protein